LSGQRESKIAFCYICPFKMARRPMQLEFRVHTWDGRRAGAGRKPSGPGPESLSGESPDRRA